jgi:hypothetical protein
VKRRRFPLIIACFVILLVLGLVFPLIGIILTPMLPTLMLDVVIAVIDPEDIADAPKRKEVLAILNMAWGKSGLIWSCAGLLVVAISGLGLWASCTSDRSSVDA